MARVRLWSLDLAELTPEILTALTGLLDAQELLRAGRFRFEDDRRSFIAAHGLCRMLLASSLELSPLEVRFVTEDGRKPRLDPAHGRPGFDFSLSHTRGFVAAAAGEGIRVGVDVESGEREHDYRAIAQAYFAPDDVAALDGLPPEERREHFFLQWTIKEAVLKAAGFGLSIPLNALSVRTNPPSVLTRDPRLASPSGWRIASYRPTERYFLAAAAGSVSSAGLPEIDHAAVDPTQLLRFDIRRG
jgi:4'-phosphopantetheinyl transferase